MRFISADVKVGVMVLQQLAHARQSVSFHTSCSSPAVSFSKPRGVCFSSLLKNRLNRPLVLTAFFLNNFMLNGFNSLMRRR
jgi:hypothetical protein